MNLWHLFTFFQPKNQLGKYTPPYRTALGDPVPMEGTVNIRPLNHSNVYTKYLILLIDKEETS